MSELLSFLLFFTWKNIILVVVHNSCEHIFERNIKSLREQCTQKGKSMGGYWVDGIREERKAEWGKMNSF